MLTFPPTVFHPLSIFPLFCGMCKITQNIQHIFQHKNKTLKELGKLLPLSHSLSSSQKQPHCCLK